LTLFINRLITQCTYSCADAMRNAKMLTPDSSSLIYLPLQVRGTVKLPKYKHA